MAMSVSWRVSGSCEMRTIVSPAGTLYFPGTVIFSEVLPDKGTGINNGTGRHFLRTLICTKKLHEKEPAQNGDHQDIKKVSFSSVEGKGFFFHRISSLRLGVQSMRDGHLIIALL